MNFACGKPRYKSANVRNYIDKLETERDALLAACKMALRRGGGARWMENGIEMDLHDIIRAAIALCEGGQREAT